MAQRASPLFVPPPFPTSGKGRWPIAYSRSETIAAPSVSAFGRPTLQFRDVISWVVGGVNVLLLGHEEPVQAHRVPAHKSIDDAVWIGTLLIQAIWTVQAVVAVAVADQ